MIEMQKNNIYRLKKIEQNKKLLFFLFYTVTIAAKKLQKRTAF